MTVSEENRRTFEDQWLKREDMREKRRAERAAKGDSGPENTSTTPLTEDGVRQALEPGFVSAAYFLRFKFDPNHYALAGREQLEGRDVLKIEYYPSQLFREGRTRPNKGGTQARRRDREQDEQERGLTLWVDPAEHQFSSTTSRTWTSTSCPADRSCASTA